LDLDVLLFKSNYACTLYLSASLHKEVISVKCKKNLRFLWGFSKKTNNNYETRL